MAALLIGGGRQLVRQLLQGIELPAATVLFQIVVGVHQVDERPQPVAHAAQRRGPDVVAAGAHLAQQCAKGVAQRVQIVAAGAFQRVQPVQLCGHGLQLARPALPQGGQAWLQLLRLRQTGAAVIVLPVIEKVVVRQRGGHVGGVVQQLVVRAGAFFQWVGHAAALGKGCGRVIQCCQQNGDKRHVIA